MGFEEQLSATLNSCDAKQLNKYLTEDEALDILVTSMDEFHDLNSEKESLQDKNRKIAEENLTKQTVIDSLKTELTQNFKELEKSKDEYYKLLTNHNEVSVHQDMSLETIYTMLQSIATKSEDETDKLAEDFFLQDDSKQYNDDELNQFQKIFIESRTQSHLKKIKAEKLKELLGNI
jgi:predicted nuclease with TOPRIM domain